MLSSDPEKLRFLGIDLHSRARRRWMVVLTYSVYFFGTSWIVEKTKTVPALQDDHLGCWLIFAASLCVMLLSVFRENGPVKRLVDFVWRGERRAIQAPPIELDESEVRTRDGLSHRTLTIVFDICAGGAILFGLDDPNVRPLEIAQIFLWIGIFAATWPKAIILWNEPDPRKNNDPQLAQQPFS